MTGARKSSVDATWVTCVERGYFTLDAVEFRAYIELRGRIGDKDVFVWRLLYGTSNAQLDGSKPTQRAARQAVYQAARKLLLEHRKEEVAYSVQVLQAGASTSGTTIGTREVP